MADLNMMRRNTQTDSAQRLNPQWRHFHYVHYFLGILTRKPLLAPDGIVAMTNAQAAQHSALPAPTEVNKNTFCNRHSRDA